MDLTLIIKPFTNMLSAYYVLVTPLGTEDTNQKYLSPLCLHSDKIMFGLPDCKYNTVQKHFKVLKPPLHSFPTYPSPSDKPYLKGSSCFKHYVFTGKALIKCIISKL